MTKEKRERQGVARIGALILWFSLAATAVIVAAIVWLLIQGDTVSSVDLPRVVVPGLIGYGLIRWSRVPQRVAMHIDF